MKPKLFESRRDSLFFLFFFFFFFVFFSLARNGRASCFRAYLDVLLPPQSYQYPDFSESTASVGRQIVEIKSDPSEEEGAGKRCSECEMSFLSLPRSTHRRESKSVD